MTYIGLKLFIYIYIYRNSDIFPWNVVYYDLSLHFIYIMLSNTETYLTNVKVIQFNDTSKLFNEVITYI